LYEVCGVTGERSPRVSIGLPVYNGERYLEEAIASMLAQTFTDFELIVIDNASTDRTPDICAKFAEIDPRVKYSRNAENIGGTRNQNLTLAKARGEYFRWAAHDDACEPDLLLRCVEALDARPDLVLCVPWVRSVHGDAEELGVRVPDEGTAPTPSGRVRELLRWQHPGEQQYGLMRTDAIRRVRPLDGYPGSDRVMLCELALIGRFAVVPETLFVKRFHEGNHYQDWRGRMAWFDPGLTRTGKVVFPNWLQLGGYARLLGRAQVSLGQRVLTAMWMAKWGLGRWRGLGKDIAVAAQMALSPRRKRLDRFVESNWR
jgi:glycosyltransferase involved in cell wall biosynthesis